jgi:ribosomal protein S18 acetylase RimI-like enzyme
MTDYIIRKATKADVGFLIEAIIQAEKGNKDTLGLSTLFELTENEVRSYLKSMLEEEVDGCEFSISSFLIAEYDGSPCAAVGGWIEGENVEHMTSSILKANLLGFSIPNGKIRNIHSKSDLIKDILIERELGTLQIEYVYVDKKHRGKNLSKALIHAHIQACINQNPNIKYIQVQVFANNEPAVKLYLGLGFKVMRSFDSYNDQILKYLPGKSKLLMQKPIIS